MITRRDFLKVTGVAELSVCGRSDHRRCPDCLRWFFFHCFFRRCIRQRGILCRS